MNKKQFIVFICVMVFLNWLHCALSFKHTSGTLASMHEFNQICRGHDLPCFMTVGELVYGEESNLLTQWIHLFGESSADLSLWLSHVKVKKREIKRCPLNDNATPEKLTEWLDGDFDLPFHVQNDFNLEKAAGGWQMEYYDTEWKEWEFHIGYNNFWLFFNPATRKFFLKMYHR